jgi:6-pyruvoyl-tetrahydropterin synthase
MQTLTGVGAIFCAAHRGTGRRDVVHGHSYEVTAWFAYDGQDAEALQDKLSHFLRSHLDHTTLRDDMARAEDVARMVLQCLGAERVEVRRPLERLYAEARR